MQPIPTAYTRVCYALGQKARWLSGAVAFLDKDQGVSPVRFVVPGDGQGCGVSPVIRARGVVEKFSVDVTSGGHASELGVYVRAAATTVEHRGSGLARPLCDDEIDEEKGDEEKGTRKGDIQVYLSATEIKPGYPFLLATGPEGKAEPGNKVLRGGAMENRLWQNRFEINSRSSQAFQHGGNRARRSTPKEEQILQKAQCSPCCLRPSAPCSGPCPASGRKRAYSCRFFRPGGFVAAFAMASGSSCGQSSGFPSPKGSGSRRSSRGDDLLPTLMKNGHQTPAAGCRRRCVCDTAFIVSTGRSASASLPTASSHQGRDGHRQPQTLGTGRIVHSV